MKRNDTSIFLTNSFIWRFNTAVPAQFPNTFIYLAFLHRRAAPAQFPEIFTYLAFSEVCEPLFLPNFVNGHWPPASLSLPA